MSGSKKELPPAEIGRLFSPLSLLSLVQKKDELSPSLHALSIKAFPLLPPLPPALQALFPSGALKKVPAHDLRMNSHTTHGSEDSVPPVVHMAGME